MKIRPIALLIVAFAGGPYSTQEVRGGIAGFPCDDTDHVQLVAFTGSDRLIWNPEPEALTYNVYLQSLDHHPTAFQGSCLYWSVPENSVLLRGEPAPGTPWMFDVTLVSVDGEGPLGYTSSCTPRTPLAPCTCTLPADVGPCDGVFPRWFHDFTTGQCEQFIWGGCDGNANNFETPADCEATCLDPCDQPAVQGDCEAAIPRWYHNVLTGQCEQFIWGGCDPGVNNFVTRAECEAACG